MTGKITDIDYVCGSHADQEGGITVIMKDRTEMEGSTIEFNWEANTFDLS